MVTTRMNDETTTPLTSGIGYYQAQDLVETIVSMKKSKYNFPGNDPEDLGQDIRLECWRVLQLHDPNKQGKSLFHYVARCVDNYLYNKFRGIYLDNNPPCLRCDDYIKETKSCRIEEEGCTRIVQYRNRMSRRRAIAAPLSYNVQLDSDGDGDYSYHESLSVGSQTGVCDLNDTLRSSLDRFLVPFYDKMITGMNDEVPDHMRRLVQQQIKIILEKQ